MSLANNTTELQEILATINNLPEAGGGGTPNATVTIIADGTPQTVTEYDIGTLQTISLSAYDILSGNIKDGDGNRMCFYVNQSQTTASFNITSAHESVSFYIPASGATISLTLD